jgi:hypothetical protein
MIRPFKWIECSGSTFDALYQPKEGLFRESALCWFLGLCLGCYSITFRICKAQLRVGCSSYTVKALAIVDRISLLVTEQVLFYHRMCVLNSNT